MKNKFLFKTKLSILVLYAALCLSGPVIYTQGFDTAYARILHNKITQIKTTYNMVGLSAAVYVPGQGMWRGTTGISAIGDSLSPDMVMGAGSITKNFNAVTILQLLEANQLSLNDTIGRWLPAYQNVSTGITIKQLLNHSSGLYNYTENPAFLNQLPLNWERYWTPEEILTDGYVLTPYFPPGTTFRYSNTNFLILGMIITRITNTNLSTQFHSRFFTPYNLTNTFLEVEDTITVPFAHNWVDIDGNGILDDAFFIPRRAVYSGILAAGGMVSRPDNLVNWLRVLHNGQVLQPGTKTLMLTAINGNVSGANGYGLGIMRYNVSGKICWGHGGNIFGYSSVMMYSPTDSIYIAMMTNRDIDMGNIGKDFMLTALNNNPIGIISTSNGIPEQFKLYQNYPNPFNPVTNIAFELPEDGFTTLKIYNALGQEVKTLVSSKLNKGNYTYDWDASSHATGVYFYTLESGNFKETKKMILIK